jgi:nucleotide-binding universal stress UspA family protein
MYDTILVPTDGSTGAEAAAEHGLNLAAAFGSQIHFLSVVDARTYGGADGDSEARARESPLYQQASEAVATLEDLATGTGITCHTAVQEGVPHEAILDYAGDHGVDLVSMGTHGRTGLSRLLLGSVAERVVRTSDWPVLSSRHPPEDDGYDRVLVPTDGSETATAAVDHALAIAAQYDAAVHAVSVIDTSALAGAFDAGPVLPEVIDSLTEGCEDAVAAVADRCADCDVDVVTAVKQGTPYRVISNYVEEADIDMVAMGTHGRQGVGRYIMGSVTERVVRTSDVPVLTTR